MYPWGGLVVGNFARLPTAVRNGARTRPFEPHGILHRSSPYVCNSESVVCVSACVCVSVCAWHKRFFTLIVGYQSHPRLLEDKYYAYTLLAGQRWLSWSLGGSTGFKTLCDQRHHQGATTTLHCQSCYHHIVSHDIHTHDMHTRHAHTICTHTICTHETYSRHAPMRCTHEMYLHRHRTVMLVCWGRVVVGSFGQ